MMILSSTIFLQSLERPFVSSLFLWTIGFITFLIVWKLITAFKHRDIYPFLFLFVSLLLDTILFRIIIDTPDSIVSEIGRVIAIIFLCLLILAQIHYLIRVSDQKFFNIRKLYNALKFGIKPNKYSNIYHLEASEYDLDHILQKSGCLIKLKKGKRESMYYLLEYKEGRPRPLTRWNIIKKYFGLPKLKEGLLICKKAGNLKGIYNIISKKTKEKGDTIRKYPEISALINNTLNTKMRKKGKPYLEFTNDGMPIISVFLPNIRYEKYYINGDIAEHIDKLVCQLDKTIERIDSTFMKYMESKKSIWPSITKILVPIATMFLFGTILPDFFENIDTNETPIGDNNDFTLEDTSNMDIQTIGDANHENLVLDNEVLQNENDGSAPISFTGLQGDSRDAAASILQEKLDDNNIYYRGGLTSSSNWGGWDEYTGKKIKEAIQTARNNGKISAAVYEELIGDLKKACHYFE